MADTIATPFTTKPKETVVVKDVRNDTSTAPVSNLLRQTDNNILHLADVIQKNVKNRLTHFDADAVKELTKLKPKNADDWFRYVVPGGIKLDMDVLKNDAVGSVLKAVGYKGDVSSMANKLINVVEGKASAATLIDTSPLMKVVVNGLSQPIEMLQKAAGKDLSVVNKLVKKLTGNDELLKFTNLDARGALTKEINKQLMKYNIPEFHDEVTKDFSPAEKVAVAADPEVLHEAIKEGNVHYVNWTMDTLGSSYVKETIPQSFGQLLSSFKFDPYHPHEDQVSTFLTTLQRMNPNAFTNNDTGNECTFWATISDDAKTALSEQPLCGLLIACSTVLTAGPAYIGISAFAGLF